MLHAGGKSDQWQGGGGGVVAGICRRDSGAAGVLLAAAGQSLAQTERSVATVPGGTDQIVVLPVVDAGRVLGVCAMLFAASDDPKRFSASIDAVNLRVGALEAHFLRADT